MAIAYVSMNSSELIYLPCEDDNTTWRGIIIQLILYGCQSVMNIHVIHNVEHSLHQTNQSGISWISYLHVYSISSVKCDEYACYVAVLERNRMLYCRVFQAHHWAWCATALSFCWGRGSYAVHWCVRYSCIYTSCMSPGLSGSSAQQTQWCGWNMRRNNIQF